MSIRHDARRKATEQYLQRLDELNIGAGDKTVLDSIDRPMRPLILELHRIGWKTTFSCCGFTYEDESLDEPKTHHATQTYVFLKNRAINQTAKENMDALLGRLVNDDNPDWSWKTSTRIRTAKGESIIHLYYTNPLKDTYNKKDGLDSDIHGYEAQVIAIKRATDFIKTLPTAVDKIVIHDGNNDYFEAGFDEWQVNPKPDYIADTGTTVGETHTNEL